MICMQGVQQEPRTPSPIRSRVISPNNQVHSQNTLKVSLLLGVVLNTTIIMPVMFWRLKRETIHTQIEFFFFFAKVSHSSNSKASCFQGEPAAAAARWFPHTVQQTTHAKTGGELVMKSCWWLTLGLIKITAVSKFQQGRPFPDSDNIFLPDPTPSNSPRFPSRVSQPTNQVFWWRILNVILSPGLPGAEQWSIQLWRASCAEAERE